MNLGCCRNLFRLFLNKSKIDEWTNRNYFINKINIQKKIILKNLIIDFGMQINLKKNCIYF